jgi:hypothetical protein
MKRVVLMALGVILALASPIALAPAEQTSQLAADWWQWAVSKPVADNPLIGGGSAHPSTRSNKYH